MSRMEKNQSDFHSLMFNMGKPEITSWRPDANIFTGFNPPIRPDANIFTGLNPPICNLMLDHKLDEAMKKPIVPSWHLDANTFTSFNPPIRSDTDILTSLNPPICNLKLDHKLDEAMKKPTVPSWHVDANTFQDSGSLTGDQMLNDKRDEAMETPKLSSRHLDMKVSVGWGPLTCDLKVNDKRDEAMETPSKHLDANISLDFDSFFKPKAPSRRQDANTFTDSGSLTDDQMFNDKRDEAMEKPKVTPRRQDANTFTDSGSPVVKDKRDEAMEKPEVTPRPPDRDNKITFLLVFILLLVFVFGSPFTKIGAAVGGLVKFCGVSGSFASAVIVAFFSGLLGSGINGLFNLRGNQT